LICETLPPPKTNPHPNKKAGPSSTAPAFSSAHPNNNQAACDSSVAFISFLQCGQERPGM
jgi:hypothetical protein